MRDKYVSDLAKLYGVETRALMQGVKRNRERFPLDFMFVLTRPEILRISQIVISLKYSKSVYAFTEQGVAMFFSFPNSPAVAGQVVWERTLSEVSLHDRK